jgi:hypothetical protein
MSRWDAGWVTAAAEAAEEMGVAVRTLDGDVEVSMVVTDVALGEVLARGGLDAGSSARLWPKGDEVERLGITAGAKLEVMIEGAMRRMRVRLFDGAAWVVEGASS